MEQIIYWNLVDGYTYVPSADLEQIRSTQGNMTVGENVYYGGLIRFDMTPKPAYVALDRLINSEWRTNLDLKADSNGKATFRGFFGEYEIEITKGKKTVRKKLVLSKDAETFQVTFDE